MNNKFHFFWHGSFSQWHLAEIRIAGMTFNCCEQFMMWSKAILFGDAQTAQKVLQAASPKQQKALGRQAKGYNEQIWKSFRGGIVYTGNYAKFTQHINLKTQLLATRGTILVEASPLDTVWGIGLKADDPRSTKRTQWNGLNLLGFILTRVRETILAEQDLLK